MVEEKVIQAPTFKHVEQELYNYHRTVQLLKLRREELLHGSSGQTDENVGGGRSNLPSSPTERRAIALRTDVRLAHLEMTVNNIEYVIHRLPPHKLELVKLKYWTHPQTLTADGMALKLNCSRSAFFKWRAEIVTAIAEQFGWI